MKKILCLILACVLCFALCLCSCSDDENNTPVINTESGGTAEYMGDIGTLDSSFEGDWEVSALYQEARITNIFPDEGLATESTQCIHFGSDFYESYGYHYDTPYYNVQTVSSDVLNDYGFSAENIEKDFSDTVKMIMVSNGEPVETKDVYFVMGDNLIKFGQGAHLYLCTRVQAVG